MVAGYLIDNATARTILEVGGGLTLAGGYYAAYYGRAPDEPRDPRGRSLGRGA